MEDGQTIRVRDVDRVLEFQGTRIAEATTETPEALRWTDFELYRLTDGTGRYVLTVVGRSVVYHLRDSECNSGTAISLQTLSEDDEPCPRCHPPRLEETAENPLVQLESDRYAVHVCAGPPEVLAQLRLPPRENSTLQYSAPALRLLDAARRGDPVFEAALLSVERL